MRIIHGHYLLCIVFLHSQFQLHTASVSIVLISRANLPIVQSTILPPSRAKTTQDDGTMGNSSYSLFGRKTISELRAIVRSRRREITFVSFIYSVIFFQLTKRAKFRREFPTKYICRKLLA